MPDVVDLIERDHRAVEQLFAQFESSKDDAVTEQICAELTAHMVGEERAVYPVVAEKLSGGKKLAEDAENEHKEARQLIGRIRNTTDTGRLTELTMELKQAIQHHVQEEETAMLPKARQDLSAEELNEMGAQFEEAKEAAG